VASAANTATAATSMAAIVIETVIEILRIMFCSLV
jgi:hypothetical protein